tara:strand:+ start:479 stop:667 length:189 start_codon:yes stop_codon:yes gene_type:complete
MRNLCFFTLLALGVFCPVKFTYAHLYDSIGVEASFHVHEAEGKASSSETKCFEDPKFGQICK